MPLKIDYRLFDISDRFIDEHIKTDNIAEKYVIWFERDSTHLASRVGSVALIIIASLSVGVLTGFPILATLATGVATLLLGLMLTSKLDDKRCNVYTEECIVRTFKGQKTYELDKLPTHTLTGNLNENIIRDISKTNKLSDPITKIIDSQGKTSFCFNVLYRLSNTKYKLFIRPGPGSPPTWEKQIWKDGSMHGCGFSHYTPYEILQFLENRHATDQLINSST